MDAFTGSRPFNFKSLSDFSHLEKNVQTHLKRVYSSLAICMIAACAGAYVRLFYSFVGQDLMFLASIGLLFGIRLTQHTTANLGKRMAMLVGLAASMGMNLGRLIGYVIRINAAILPTALLGTGVVFVCFTLAALYTHKRSFLFLGGMLSSGLSIMSTLLLANIFLGSQMLYSVELYLGLAVMCGCVLYDTQLIVEKRRQGGEQKPQSLGF